MSETVEIEASGDPKIFSRRVGTNENFDTFTRPDRRKLLEFSRPTTYFANQQPEKQSIMRALIRSTLRVLPAAFFALVGTAAYAQSPTPQQLEEVRQYKAKIDANLDNANFDKAAAQAELDALMAAYGITEIPAQPVTQPAVSALRSPATGEAKSTLSEPSRASLIKALQDEIELYKDDPAMSDYVNSLRERLTSLQGNN
jgi:hypothetical protein